MTNRNEHFVDKKVYENLQPYQNELFKLTELAGINISPLYIWVFVQLLNMNLPPDVIYKLMKLVRRTAKSTRSRRVAAIKGKSN